MIIHKIKCKNFKSFRDEITIDFDNLQGLYKVSGRIGSGKTTIGEAIIFGLFGSINGKNNCDLISWGEKHGLIEVWYTCRANDIYIRREINSYGPNPLHVEVNGKELEFTNKRNAQEQLENEYMDATRTIMELLCVISFNSFKSLSTLNSKQSKEFLDYVFNFDILSQYATVCSEKNRDIRKAITNNQSKISVMESQVERLKQYVGGDIDATKHNINKIKNELKARSDRDKNIMNEMRLTSRKLHTRLGETKAAGTNKKREIDLIKKGTCPTCGAPIDGSNLKNLEHERELLLESYNDIHSQIQSLTGQISRIENELNNYTISKQAELRKQENELSRLKEQERLSTSEVDVIERNIENLKISIKQQEKDSAEYTQLYQILSEDIKQSVLSSFIPILNNNIIEISNILNMQFVPEFDSNFTCTVCKEGIQVPTSSLSTGQLKLVDMVIILAVLGSIMSHASTNIIFLDELFSNLDSTTRSDLIGALRFVLPKTCSVLIVSHQDIDNELFDGHIKMTLTENKDKQKQTSITYFYNE